MWLIVGLGNPGPKYAFTRHNIGFLAVDVFSQSLGDISWIDEHKAHVYRIKIKSKIYNKAEPTQIVIAKPQTYMNKSGESVVALLNYYKIDKEKLLVIQDDIDQVFGKIRFHKNRGHGGHNGIRSISELLGTQDYTRLKLGIGRPSHPEMEIADYVLGKFQSEEQAQLPDFLNKTSDAIESLIFEGLSKASTQFNS